MPCSPVPALARFIRLCLAASRRRNWESAFDDAAPKLILTASCGLEPKRIVPYKPLVDEAISLAKFKPQATLLFHRPQGPAMLHERDWAELVAAAKTRRQQVPCVELAATGPLYILYTSGTTGKPKGVVRDNGGHMVALKWTMKNLYGVNPGEVFWAASDVGWVVGRLSLTAGFHNPLVLRFLNEKRLFPSCVKPGARCHLQYHGCW